MPFNDGVGASPYEGISLVALMAVVEQSCYSPSFSSSVTLSLIPNELFTSQQFPRDS